MSDRPKSAVRFHVQDQGGGGEEEPEDGFIANDDVDLNNSPSTFLRGRYGLTQPFLHLPEDNDGTEVIIEGTPRLFSLRKMDEDDESRPKEWQRDECGFVWSENHCVMLHLISLYARPATSAEGREGWLRRWGGGATGGLTPRSVPLTVLTFELIVCGVASFDYAPVIASIPHQGRVARLYVNVSQEGAAVVDDLRERRMLNALKLQSEDLSTSTAVQISTDGLRFASRFPRTLRQDVERVVFGPRPYDNERLEVDFDGEAFHLISKAGYKRQSKSVGQGGGLTVWQVHGH